VLIGRIRALDAFRGLTVAAMILVNNPGSWSHVYPPLAHAEWNGWTPTDLIFPFFLFIVGVSIIVAFARREREGASGAQLLRKALLRGVIIIALGLLLSGFPKYDLATIRIPGVLQRIGAVYLLTAGIYVGFGPGARRVLAAAFLLGYWALLELVPVPGFGPGVLTPEGNLAAYLDRLLLAGHLWQGAWDPEGLLSTIPAVGTCLLGTFAGERLAEDRPMTERTVRLFAMGAVWMVLGLAGNALFPINKNLWTSSYALFTAGVASQVLAFCYWVIDFRGRERWAGPFYVFGTNALLAFVLSGLLARTLGLWQLVGADGASIPASRWVYERWFMPFAGPLNGSLLFALANVGAVLVVVWVFYRKGWILKV
jgi:predicted acyltransferase